MAPVDTKNPPPDNVQDITTASGNGQRRRGKPVPQRPVEPTAPLIDSPGDVDLFDMDPKSIVTRRRYRDEPPTAPATPPEEPSGEPPRESESSGPSQSAEDLVDAVQHPAPGSPIPGPSQSDDELIEQLEEIRQGSSAAIAPVIGTAYLPADTPTSRPKPPRRRRARRRILIPGSTRTRGRARKAYLSGAVLLVVAVAIAAVATSGPRAPTASSLATRARSGLVATSTETVNPLQLIAAAIAPVVKKEEAVDRSRARRDVKKTVRRHQTHRVKRTTAPPVHSAAAASSQEATTTAAPAPSTSSNNYRPAATQPRAPSQQAGPTGPGTTVGKNCDPQCS